MRYFIVLILCLAASESFAQTWQQQQQYNQQVYMQAIQNQLIINALQEQTAQQAQIQYQPMQPMPERIPNNLLSTIPVCSVGQSQAGRC